MKKLSFLLIAFLAGIILLSSCNKDEETLGPPTINFIGGEGYIDGDATIPVNSFFKMGIAASANAESGKELSTLRLTRAVNGTTFIDTTYTINESMFNADFTFNAQAAGITETITFTLTDKADKTASISANITSEAAGVAVTKNTDVLMGSHNDDNGSFYSTVNKLVYNIADASANQADIDFLFYLGATNGSTIASPADEDANTVYAITDWTTKNATLFTDTELTAEAFDAIGAEYVFPEFTGDLTDINNLEAGSVIMFKTVGDKLGLIKVNQINGRGDFINLDIIVAE